ncbi:MAG: hypothetical protein UY47_C0001G0027 [Parcubacteria group bacterium GW2011_GWB1_49_7]|uniref:Uncharacterized protein n=1 Tax=Candidatus Zambryskibacteria bacterium RIFCSPHIGHO2_01_FULL_46_25 TaxID=1802738 RepID=A0A1G2T1D3_9BACT|nr:MAG: hypothetical protein UY47_C0001G0027 [Parcubacteria group bacterium GW2011_GWB1_49_7]OHA90441.1 MAG: hypothetical protein A2838_02525 [Candidatus Zambryskibacteria bacterium RIFCSPHIGHO2_01_FULL_46_25]OHB00612.1 MAG: hypothetical protein A3F53_01435 [Candidatus Zambryskibacteria bacterium RIFCSPHIGHO2_12_FULL_48_10]OHB06979.1 MAG: hypothetical protein A3A31_01660 [Candidatus Zambryskibacteria bacterium RIFCSPLOWO2_01_FULL_48_25]
MFHSIQMQKTVDKEFSRSKRFHSRKVDENFSGIFRQRETQNVGWFVFTAISAIEAAREHVSTENKRELVLFAEYSTLQNFKIFPGSPLACLILD